MAVKNEGEIVKQTIDALNTGMLIVICAKALKKEEVDTVKKSVMFELESGLDTYRENIRARGGDINTLKANIEKIIEEYITAIDTVRGDK